LLLDVFFSCQIQFKIHHGGFNFIVAQMIFDLNDGMAASQHPNGAAMTKTVDGIDLFETFC
jgi:hypothetical protein